MSVFKCVGGSGSSIRSPGNDLQKVISRSAVIVGGRRGDNWSPVFRGTDNLAQKIDTVQTVFRCHGHCDRIVTKSLQLKST